MKIIKKEILIAAPAAKVWEHITDSNKIAGWWKPNDFAPSVGQAFTIQCGSGHPVTGVVQEIVPLRKLSYTFRSAVVPVDTLVTFTLVEEGSQTRLTLVHSGWDALPPDKQNVSNDFENGWGTLLPIIQQQLAGAEAK